jgi:hypothetical protein
VIRYRTVEVAGIEIWRDHSTTIGDGLIESRRPRHTSTYGAEPEGR